jgi:DNA repair exonuclease SbcCD nuclease subunit
MSDIKFITFTDVHISDINPQERRGSYRDDILHKLKQIKAVGKKLNVDFFICAGDLFNLKAPMRNSHELTSMLIELFKSFPAPVYMTEGNHDLRNDSYDEFDKQPLNVIYKSGAMIQLRSKEVWDKNKEFSIKLRSFPFQENPILSDLPKSSDNDFSVCVLHLYSTKDGGDLFGQQLFSYPEIAELNDDIFVLGHYHIDQGVEKLNTYGKDQQFINVGAISRGSLSEDNINRIPKFSLVTVTPDKKAKIQVVKLKVRPAEEAFYLERKKKQKEKIERATEFVEKLKTELEDKEATPDNIDDNIKDLKIGDNIIKRVKHYMEEADLLLKGSK